MYYTKVFVKGSPFQLSLMLRGRPEPTQAKHLSGGPIVDLLPYPQTSE